MSWTTPKTNWNTNEYFNSNPDYERIKGNIEYIYDLAVQLYGSFSIATMVTPSYDANGACITIPTVSFYNNIVSNISTIKNATYEPTGYRIMRVYVAGEYIWDYKELNIIENNIKLLYNVLQGQINILEQLPFNLESDGI